MEVGMKKSFILILCIISFNSFASDSPWSTISDFYSIRQKVSYLINQYDKEFNYGHYSETIVQEIKDKLLLSYEACLTGAELDLFKDNLANHFCINCDDLSFYCMQPCQIIKKKLITNDGRKAIAEIIFCKGKRATFYLERTEAGWRINKIVGYFEETGW
jgi:hypothetical protein